MQPSSVRKILQDEFKTHLKEDPETGCLFYIGPSGPSKRVCFDGEKYVNPSRRAYELFVGEKPKDKRIGHSCRKGHCCNIDHIHLYQATAKQMARDEELRYYGSASKDF